MASENRSIQVFLNYQIPARFRSDGQACELHFVADLLHQRTLFTQIPNILRTQNCISIRSVNIPNMKSMLNACLLFSVQPHAGRPPECSHMIHGVVINFNQLFARRSPALSFRYTLSRALLFDHQPRRAQNIRSLRCYI